MEHNNTSVEKPLSSTLFENDSSEESFFISIAKHEYVLVIGDEVILKDEYASGHSKRFWKSKLRPYNERISDGNISRKSALNKVFDKEDLHNMVNPELVQLLKTRCFPIVITTSIDPCLQLFMQDIWGDDLKVLNIFSEHRDWDSIPNSYEFGIAPTLYYAFGSAYCHDQCGFAWTENDMMKALTKWINIDAPSKFLRYIWNNKKILALGCTFSDWYFRFLWYTLCGGIDNQDRLHKGNIALTLDEQNEMHQPLIDYFQETLDINVDKNARDFLKRFNMSLSVCSTSTRGKNLIKYQRLGGVFISYAHEDFVYAERLYYTLRSKGVNVWFDNKDLGYVGNVGYEERISNALLQARIFIPILSHQVKADLGGVEGVKGNENRWYMTNEWQKVHKDVLIAPICIEDYSERSDYHQIFIEKVANRKKIQKVFVGDKGYKDGKKFSVEDFVNEIKNVIG